MKVLEKGTPFAEADKDWSKEVVCSAEENEMPDNMPPCGARLEVEESDLILRYYKGNFGGRHYYAAYRCSECGRVNMVGGISDSVWYRLTRDHEATWDGWQDK